MAHEGEPACDREDDPSDPPQTEDDLSDPPQTEDDLSDPPQTCIVCFEELGVALRPCLHRVCADCTLSWMQRGHSTCPMCRGTILGFDPHPTQQPEHVDPNTSLLRDRMYITIDFPENTHAGVTVCDHPRGVRIKALCKQDRGALCGLRYGDIVSRINNLPITNHAHAVQLFDHSAQNGESILCEVIRRVHRLQMWWDVISVPP